MLYVRSSASVTKGLAQLTTFAICTGPLLASPSISILVAWWRWSDADSSVVGELSRMSPDKLVDRSGIGGELATGSRASGRASDDRRAASSGVIDCTMGTVGGGSSGFDRVERPLLYMSMPEKAELARRWDGILVETGCESKYIDRDGARAL